MLSIYIHGNSESGFLDLDTTSSLSMEELAPAFDEELSTGEYSLPYDGILWSENNRRLLNQAQALNNVEANNIFTCSVFDKNFPEIVRGKLTLLTKNGKLNYRSGKFSVSISGSKGMFGSVISKKKLTDLTLTGRIEWSGMDSREFAQELMDGNLSNDYWMFSFVPVAIESFFNQDRSDYSGEFLAKDCVNNLVQLASSQYEFGRPTSANPNVSAAMGTAEYIDYRTVPFLRIVYVLRKCFEEFGYQIMGDFINDSAFYNLLLFNNYSIEKYNVALFLDTNRSISPQNHVPKILISDFLKGLLNLFGLYPIFSENNTVELRYRKRNVQQKNPVNIDKIITENFESEFPQAVATSGYKLNYQWDGADSIYSDRVKDLSTKTICATVQFYNDLLTLNIGRSFTTDDIALVAAENMYYQVADATTTPVIKWDAFSDRQHEYVKGDGEEPKDFPISTLCQYTIFNDVTGLVERKNFLGCRQGGSYINNKNTLVTTEYGLRLFYGKNLLIDGVTRPVSYTHNRHPYTNALIEQYSIAWQGDEGLAENFHTQWQNSLMNKELIRLSVLSIRKNLLEIKAGNIIELKSMHFVFKRLERTIPAGNTMTVFVSSL